MLKPTDDHTQAVIDICSNVIPYFTNTFFSRYVNDYKLYLWYKWDRAKKILPWQTNINMPIVPAIVDTMYSSMYDSKMKFNLNGWVEWQDVLLNKAFDYKNNWRNVLLQSVKEAIITGKWFLKAYFNHHTDKIIINWTDYWATVKRPELSYISIFDVFYDYNSSIEDSPFQIERHILSRKSIMKRYKSLITKAVKNWTLNEQMAESYIDWVLKDKDCRRFSNYDYNRVRNILAYEDLIVKEMKDTNAYIDTTVWERNKATNWAIWVAEQHSSIDHLNNIFWVDFDTNKVYEVIEYRDDNNFTVIIDGKKLFNKKESNIVRTLFDISFNAIPWTSDSTGIASNIWDIQTMINTLQNIFLDWLKMNTSPMYEQVGWLNQMLWNKNKVVYEPFKIIPTNTAWALKKIEMWLWWFEPVNAVQFLEWVAEKRVWVNEYIIWGQGKVERVSGWVDLIYNQYKSKLMPVTNSVNQAMAWVAKAFLIMYATYFTKDELNELWLTEDFNVKDLINEEWVTFQLTSLALLEKEEWIKHLMDNLWALSQFVMWSNWPNINTKELVRAILTKEVDIDKLVPESEPKPQFSPSQWQQDQWQSQQFPSWSLSAMAENI